MNIRQQYIAKSKYARYLDHKGRRENWQETVSRYTGFMVKKLQERGYDMSIEEITEIYEAILNQEVMPSMRLLMTAGPAAERSNIAIYNCSFLRIDDQKAFDEAMYILLNGVGVGFSVEQDAVNKLPEVPVQLFDSETTVVVADSKEGWAKALRQVIALLYSGEIPRWDLSKVRARGKRLKTFGGRASGPEVLDQLFRFLVKVFKGAVGRKLSSLECHDVVCKIAEVVVVGGTRRSALLSASDLHDDKMRHAKAGNWWDTNPERGLANNSAVYTSKPSVTEFMDEWKSLILSGSGERGIFNRKGAEQHALKADRKLKPGSGLNPCAEILLNNYQFCNLSTIVVKPTDSKEYLMRKIRLAALLGTYQATLTDFKYLRPCWKKQTEEEALLGVSMTGILDHPLLRQVSEETATFLQQLRDEAVRANKEYAQAFGINPAASVTSIKPEGSVSQLCNTASGIHPNYSEYYIRSYRQDNKDPLTDLMKQAGVKWEPADKREDTTTVFYFPVKAPEGAFTRDQMSALEHLELWLQYRRHFTQHNPSITVNVKPDEWLEVGAWVYRHFDEVVGVSFLPWHDEDHTYRQLPFQACTKEQYEELLAQTPESIDWDSLIEYDDNVEGVQTLACASGYCEQ